MAIPVIVKVTETASGGSTTIKIETNPDPLPLQLQGNGPIEWTIVSAGISSWEFSGKDGIQIKSPAGHFNNHGPSSDNKSFTWERVRPDGNTYKYAISVTNNIMTVICDPSIINQP